MILQRRRADHQGGKMLVFYKTQHELARNVTNVHTWVLAFGIRLFPLCVLRSKDADRLQRLAKTHVVAKYSVQLIHS